MVPADLSKVFKFGPDIDASSNTILLPSSSKYKAFKIVGAGYLGVTGGNNATGLLVTVGDVILCINTTEEGTYTNVGSNWIRIANSTLTGGINTATTNFITSGTVEITDCYSGILNNYGQVNDVDATLPAAAKGMSLLVLFGTTVAKYYRILPATGDAIYYEGATMGTGATHYVGVASTVVGQVLQFVSFQTGAETYSWIVMPNFSGLVTP